MVFYIFKPVVDFATVYLQLIFKASSNRHYYILVLAVDNVVSNQPTYEV